MMHRRVGASGLRVSAIGLGGWLTLGEGLDAASSTQILNRAVELGINFLDLADVYGEGEAEREVGRLLGRVRRSSLVISSKVFWPTGDGPNDRGLSRKHVLEACEASLRNLGTDYLDIYFCHREDPNTPLEETAKAMNDLVRQGKILYWGTSLFEPKTLRNLHALCETQNLERPIVEQSPYNLADRYVERNVMPTTHQLGMGLTVFSPLGQGLLTGKYDGGVPKESRGAKTRWLDDVLTQKNLARAKRFSSLARSASVTPAQLALAALLRRNEVSSVITGASSVAQLEENVVSAGLSVPQSVFAQVDKIFPPPRLSFDSLRAIARR